MQNYEISIAQCVFVKYKFVLQNKMAACLLRYFVVKARDQIKRLPFFGFLEFIYKVVVKNINFQ